MKKEKALLTMQAIAAAVSLASILVRLRLLNGQEPETAGEG